MVDTALASLINLFLILIIGAVFGVTILGEFSLVLIYSSFVYLFVYNFIIVPATSKNWSIGKIELVRKVTVLTLVSTIPLSLIILSADTFIFRFSEQHFFLSLLYIISHNTFNSARRIVLHLRVTKYPTLIPAITLVLMAIVVWLGFVSYQWLIIICSISYLIPTIVIMLRSQGRELLPDIGLALKFFYFSRWMTFGIWFQWLSGNLVQLIVQHQSGTESLGLLRILMSSFGFLSIYFQYHEIILTRKYISEKSPHFILKSILMMRGYITPIILIILCLPVYIIYSYIIGVPPHMGPAIVYAIYQLLVLVSIILRVHLRLMNDMLYSTIGYFIMVISVLIIEYIYRDTFQLMTASLMYVISIGLMVITLIIGLKKLRASGVE